MTTINSIPHDSEAAAEILIPTTGMPWGMHRSDPPPADPRPMACAAFDAADPYTDTPPSGWRQEVIRQAVRAFFWRGVAVGLICAGSLAAAVFLALASGLRGVA